MSTEISLLTQTDLQNAGSVLHEATIYLNKYKSKHLELIELAKTAGEKLPKDVDDKLMAWQVSAKKAVKYIEEKRKPFTEKAHAFIKAFTAVENEIGAKLYNEIQNIRDKSAAIHAKEEAEKAKQQAMVANMVAEANREVEAPKAIESYSITISSIDGWRSVIEYFLSNSGTPVEDLGKIRLDQMKAFAEKQAKASGEMIEHKDINYDAKYKAVARATKKKVA